MSVNEPNTNWRLRTLGGIPIKVKERTGTFEKEAASGTEVFIMRSSDLLAFLTESFPLPINILGSILYPRPRFYSGLGSLITTRVSFKSLVDGKPVDPFGGDLAAPSGTYDNDIEVTIDYTTNPQNDTESDPNDPFTFLEISADVSGTFITIPTRGVEKWEVDGGEDEVVTEPDLPLSKTEPETEWTIKWSQIPASFVTDTLMLRMRAALGKLNSTPMTVLFNAPVDTVLFGGYTLDQQFTWRTGTTGRPPVEIQMSFLEKNAIDGDGNRVTWNHLFDPQKGIYRRLILEAVLNPHFLYESTNLNSIFLP